MLKKYIVIEMDRYLTCPELYAPLYLGKISYSNKAEALRYAKMFKRDSKNRRQNLIYAVVKSDFNFKKYNWSKADGFPKVDRNECVYIVEY